jgi:L-2-hydroxyglutarate oxidase LhgO
MHIPIIVGGGGLVGLLTMRELNIIYPTKEKALLEKGHYFGDLTSGRNSGVMHAGLYYPLDSLKRELCLQGNLLWEDLAKELGIPFKRCGKYLVAATIEEIPALEELFQHAKNNGVKGLVWCSEEEKKEISSYCYVEKAFFSPMSGFISPSEATTKIRDDLYKKDIPLMADYNIEEVKKEGSKFVVKTSRETFTCDIFVNAMGGFAPKLRKDLGLTNIETYWVKGNYVKLNKPFYNEALIYPVPPKNLLGLGVHTSFDFDGIIRFGPDTEECSNGYEHSMSADVVDKMYPAISNLFKGIEKQDLQADYCGIRSKILVDGDIYTDFWLGDPSIHGVPGYYEYLGIESPGLTASPALAQAMVSRIRSDFSEVF